ncbi:hypothetical protein [Sphaerimonospora mesophila]|uniref:hypothetical protein n=1 Tax=Sphaerimonospora mesophila TaxID=37483 RepID=UPI00128F4465
MTATFSPQHVLQCQRHDAPIYINLEDQAGVRVGDIRMLEHPEYLAALERQAQKLGKLPVLSPCSVDATADGWVMVDGVVVASGTYRMDVGASVPHILIAP